MDRFFIDTSKVIDNHFYIEGTEKTAPKKESDNLVSRLWNGTKKAAGLTVVGLAALYATSCSGPDRAYPEVDHPNTQKIGKTTYRIQDSDPEGIFAALPKEAGMKLKMYEDAVKEALQKGGANNRINDLQSEASLYLFENYSGLLRDKGIILQDGARYSAHSAVPDAGERALIKFEYK